MATGKNILKAFGLAVKTMRHDKNISQEKLAEIGDLDRSFVSEIENGYKAASIVTVAKISTALDVMPSEIFQLIEEQVDF
jgi:transcriptional regulator with XRE-family HTH domain